MIKGEWPYADSGIGHGIDSFYEYLLKSAIYFNDNHYYSLYNEVIHSYFFLIFLL